MFVDDNYSMCSEDFTNKMITNWCAMKSNPFNIDSNTESSATSGVESEIEYPRYHDLGALPAPAKPSRRRLFKPINLKDNNMKNKIAQAKSNFQCLASTRLRSQSRAFDVMSVNLTDSDSVVSQSIDRVQTLLNSVGQYAESIRSSGASSRMSRLRISKTLVEEYNPKRKSAKTPVQTKPPVLPLLAFNENSIKLFMAFDDVHMFIMKVHEENKIFYEDHLNNSQDYLQTIFIASQENLTVDVEHNAHSLSMNKCPKYLKYLIDGLESFALNNEQPPIYKRVSLPIMKDRTEVRIRGIFEALAQGDMKKRPVIKVAHMGAWKYMVYKDGILQPNGAQSKLKGRVNIVVYLLRKIYILLQNNTQLTVRSIYYQLKSLTGREVSQTQVSNGLFAVANLLETPMWFLNIFATSKGLVYGDLSMTIGDTVIVCNKSQQGMAIPMDLNNLQKVQTSAQFILIVEKDSVFQKMIVDDVPNKLQCNFLLVTGKGFPDVQTRRFLNVLWRLLNLPMFIIADADAFGIEIMFVYKFGSMCSAFLSKELALPNLKWLGVHPSEISSYNIKTMPLTKHDTTKLKSMKNRPYFANGANQEILKEIQILIGKKIKCEIEGLFKSSTYFSRFYLPQKIYEKKFI